MVVVLLLALGVYFFYLRTPTPSFAGRTLNAQSYQEFFPLSEIRIEGKKLRIIVKAEYLQLSEEQKEDKLFRLWEAFKKKKIRSIQLFAPDRRFLRAAER